MKSVLERLRKLRMIDYESWRHFDMAVWLVFLNSIFSSESSSTWKSESESEISGRDCWCFPNFPLLQRCWSCAFHWYTLRVGILCLCSGSANTWQVLTLIWIGFLIRKWDTNLWTTCSFRIEIQQNLNQQTKRMSLSECFCLFWRDKYEIQGCWIKSLLEAKKVLEIGSLHCRWD